MIEPSPANSVYIAPASERKARYVDLVTCMRLCRLKDPLPGKSASWLSAATRLALASVEKCLAKLRQPCSASDASEHQVRRVYPSYSDRNRLGPSRMELVKHAFFAILLTQLLCLSNIADAQQHGIGPGSIKVLLLDGASGGPYHNWRLTTPVLKAELDETGLFKVTVVTAPQSNEDFTNFKPDFSQFQVIVLNYDAPDWPENLRLEFEHFVGNGGGLVVVHAADNAFPNWPAYNSMIGVGGWRGRNEQAGPMWFFKDGKLVSDTSPGPAGAHGARLPFQVVTRQPEHPIMKGLPAVWMHAADELYGKLRGPGTNMTVLATAHSDPKNRGTDHDEPMVMVLNYGKGRVFHTTLGHDVAALSCVGFMTIFQRGTEWAATGKVTQKVPPTFPTADTVSFRVDIAAMDPAFLNGASSPVRSK